MLEPENKTNLMRFLGMIEHLGKFIPNLPSKAAALQKLKLKDFDVTKPVTLSVDASSKEFGEVLMQAPRSSVEAS